MRYLAALLMLAVCGCAGSYAPRYGEAPYYRSPAYAYGDRYNAPAYRYGDSYGRYGESYGAYRQPYADSENCGTPFEPKPCPPLPRRPLAYYPDTRY